MSVKKSTFALVLLLPTFFLTGCGAQGNPGTPAASNATQSAEVIRNGIPQNVSPAVLEHEKALQKTTP